MKIQGKFREVTNLQGFVASYLAGKPDAATHKPFGKLRIHLATDFPMGFGQSFIPTVSVKTDADSVGNFSLTVPQGLPGTAKAYLLAMRHVGDGPLNIPIYAPVYRSEIFTLASIKDQSLTIYVAREKTPNDQGISQERISKEVKKFAAATKEVESVSAFIGKSGINVTAKGKGATVTFEIDLKPSTSHNLDSLIAHKVEDMDIDLPGPDFITGLCVDEDKIEKSIRDGVSGVVKDFNKQIKPAIIKAVAAQAGVPEAVVESLFNTHISMTFEQVRFPVVAEKKIGPITVKFRAVVPDPCFGLPRKLF